MNEYGNLTLTACKSRSQRFLQLMTFEQNLVLLQLHLPNQSQMLFLLLVKRCSQTLHLKVQGQYKPAQQGHLLL